MNGNFVWFDLSTTDTNGARDFYTKLFGWDTESHNPGGDMPYTMWKGANGTFGGVMPLQEDAKRMGAPPNWMGYVAVQNVDAAVDECRSLGGRVYVPGTVIPSAGKFAVLADPQGAVFAVYGESPNPQQGEWKSPVDWHELYTDDLEAGWTFYERMFGWNKTDSMDMGPEMGTYQMFGTGGKTLGGMMKRPKNVPMSAWMYYFHADDVTAATEKAKGLGASVIHGPMEVPGGTWVTMLTDPQGAVFAVHGAKGA